MLKKAILFTLLVSLGSTVLAQDFTKVWSTRSNAPNSTFSSDLFSTLGALEVFSHEFSKCDATVFIFEYVNGKDGKKTRKNVGKYKLSPGQRWVFPLLPGQHVEFDDSHRKCSASGQIRWFPFPAIQEGKAKYATGKGK